MTNTNPFPASDRESDMYLPSMNTVPLDQYGNPYSYTTQSDFNLQVQQQKNIESMIAEQATRTVTLIQSYTGLTTGTTTINIGGLSLTSHGTVFLDTQDTYIPPIDETEKLLTKLDILEKKYADKNRHPKPRKMLNWIGL